MFMHIILISDKTHKYIKSIESNLVVAFQCAGAFLGIAQLYLSLKRK